MEFTAAEIEKIVQKILTEKLSGMDVGRRRL